ncbi:protein of unknown function [Methylocella tundrae]|uniref:Uncharacterized protein n=1 Tax=Methylocella tundrae TaxID=227605 RepID=A0A4U8Z6G9_METTU|nr:hypothetical protein [Methylocella tundrae]VFU10871.1 protein of unknown function [Methylocella tundrae]
MATDQELARLRATRGELLRRLASARLDAMRSEQIAGEIASAEQRALRMIAESRATLESLSARIGAAQTARAEAETERREKAGEVARILGRLEELQAGVEPKVRGSAEWIAQKGARRSGPACFRGLAREGDAGRSRSRREGQAL